MLDLVLLQQIHQLCILSYVALGVDGAAAGLCHCSCLLVLCVFISFLLLPLTHFRVDAHAQARFFDPFVVPFERGNRDILERA